MGQSTNAMLFFGFHVGDEDELPEWLEFTEEIEDFDAWLAMKAGLPKGGTYAEQRKIAAGCPADLFTHCSSDHPMYILGVRGAELIAHRGFPTEMSATHLEISQGKILRFKGWCAANNIPYEEPKWWLCSYWG